jgi:integrase
MAMTEAEALRSGVTSDDVLLARIRAALARTEELAARQAEMRLMQTHLAARGGSAGHLIQSYRQSYANPDDGLSPKYVARMVGDVFQRAGLRDPRRPQSGHALRHTFAHKLLDAGGDVRDTQVAPFDPNRANEERSNA